ncbi:uncharacterized protein LOC135373751 isoform X2 [Ornithodoros turicata]|uniref:uncharacterized protein LOC135373751 isoform X2 n=1 Tax=Ornithodoros turicata TaxID=34597 RepID=UPI003138F161
MKRLRENSDHDDREVSLPNNPTSTEQLASSSAGVSLNTEVEEPDVPESIPVVTSEDAPQDVPNSSLFSKVFHYIYLARLEVFLVLYIFSRSLTATSIQDLLLHKACLNNLQWNSSICDHLDQYPPIKDEAEKIASNYSMLRSVISLAPSAAISIVIGPWCDRYGYKTPLLISNIGYVVSTTLVLVTAYSMSLPLYYDLLAAIPDGVLGGMISVFMAVYSEATLSTKGSQRRIKFFLLDLGLAAAYPLGNLIGGQVYGHFGIRVILRVSICVSLIAELWALVVFDVPVRAKELKDSVWTKLRRLFKVQNLTDGIRACLRVRPARGRTQLWLLFVSLCFMVMDMATMSVSYYYVRKMYSWSVQEYTAVSSISSGVTYIFYAPIVLLFSRVLKVSDLWMAATGVSFAVGQLVVCGLAYTEWLYYLQYVVGIPSFVGHVGIRTHLSKLLAEDEVGKIFSFLASCEAILPIVGEVIFTKVFQWSLDFFPGLVYLIAAAICLCSVVLLVYCARISSHSYTPLQKENEIICDDDAVGNCSISA